jgi:heavy metal sensor kinase
MSLFPRVPIRLRLTLAFVVAMAIVLSAIGLFVYVRLDAALDGTIDQSLRGRADDVTALVREARSKLSTGTGIGLAERDETFAQVLDASGAVVDSTPPLGDRRLLTPVELARATRKTVVVDERTIRGFEDPARLLATPVSTDGRQLVVVVGASLAEREEALGSLLTALLIGGPIALLLSSLVAYALAAAALRPVESMRREAEAVSATEPGRRLPLSPARDEVRRLGETLNRMLGRLETALERERRFVADASHELRTPLAMLRTELELALRRERTPEELDRALRSASEETERLSQLAEDLLVLARAQGGELPVRREQLSARELLASVRERFAGRAAGTGRDIDVETESDMELIADRLRLEQALGNLVENAIRHGSGRIGLTAIRNEGRIELHVRDEGPGFAPDLLDHAFEPFSRGGAARTGGGAGLGLAIVDVIARAHGGSAHVANIDGGAEAWIDVPGVPQSHDASTSVTNVRLVPPARPVTSQQPSVGNEMPLD